MTVDTGYGDLAYSLAGVRRTNPFDRRRQMAYGMLQQGMDTSPVQHPLQAASRLAQALVGGWMTHRVDRDEKEAVDKQGATLAAAMAEPDPQKRIGLLSAANPELGARLSGQLAVEQAKISQQTAGLQGGGQQLAAGYGMSMPSGGGQGPQQAGDAGPYGPAISKIEGDYGSVGPVANAQGHRAYGKFQVLEPNIGPWTQEILGKAMTPQEFLQNPQAQDAVFKAKFGQYVQQYGSPEAASRAWFAGPGGMNNPNARDVNGMTVARYGQQFTQNLGQSGAPPQVAQGGNPQAAPGMPPAPSPQGLSAPTVSAPPSIPDVPYPQPTPDLLAKHEQLLKSGAYGRDINTALPAARAAIKAELDQQWQVARERSKMEYEQRYGEYKDTRKRDAEAPQKNFDNAAKLRDDFTKEPVVKAYRVVVPMLESAKDAATRPTRAADINLVYAFAKLMDPDSVVRESETGMVQASATVQDRLQGLIGQLNGNPMLQPDTRQKLLAELQSRFNSLATSYQEIEGAYGGIADSSGIKREHVILPIRKPGQGPQIESPAKGNYAGPDGKAVTWDEIEATAKNRGISTDEVIKRLQLKGAR